MHGNESIAGDGGGNLSVRSQGADREVDVLTGQFRDPVIERRFRLSGREEWIRQLYWVTLISAVFYLAGGVVDYLLAGPGWRFFYLMLARMFFVSGALVLCWAAKRIKEPAHLDWLVTAALTGCTGSTCVILALTPGWMVQQPLTMVVVILTYYLFVPNRPLLTLASGWLASLAFVVVSLIYIPYTADQPVLLVIFLGMGNVLGTFSAWRLHILHRKQYAAMLAQREAVERLRREVEERQRAELAARDSQERFRRLIELSPDAVVVHRDHKILYANRAALELTGHSPGANLRGHDMLEFVHPDDREPVKKRLAQMKAQGLELDRNDLRIAPQEGKTVICEVISGPTTFDSLPAVQTVLRDISERKRMEAELRFLATTDSLTTLGNRRHFLELSQAEMERSRRYGSPISVMVMDLDEFKKVNDRHGHAVGDAMLRHIARIVRDSLRAQDIVGRLGGEEFGVTLPETGLEAARQAAERIRKAVADQPLEHNEVLVGITVSIGLALCDPVSEAMDEVLLRADRALYAAKESGRDRVCLG